MSRKLILTIAAAATVAVATLASQSADARGFGGGGFGGGGFGRGFGGGGFSSGRSIGMARGAGPSPGRLIPILNPGGPRNPIHPIFPGFPGHPGLPGHPGWWWWAHNHGHWIFRDGRWIVDDVVVDAAPVMTAPGPCTCLTKTYTPSGLVVFADVCTKESASAAVNASSADAAQGPTTPVAAQSVPMSVVPTAPNYAGHTYEDYLAANPQATQPQAANPPAQAPQKN
jgi:hypothetical protein